MQPDGLRAALGPVGIALARNLPLTLLGCGAYFVFFRDVWGPLRVWKLAVAALTILSLALAVRRADSAEDLEEARRRQRPGGHAAVLRATWPPWRRAAAVVSGALLCFAGIYQSLGREVDLGAYPLVSGLCLIVSVAVGAILVARGWPREAWRPRLPRRAPRPPLRPGEAPTASRAGGTTMKLPLPRDPGYGGHFRSGAMGTRPAPRPWMPGAHTRSAEPEGPVPRRFRGLRLIRRRGPREDGGNPVGLLLLVIVVLAVFGVLLRGCF